MRRVLLPLSGLAMIAVVLNHISHRAVGMLFETAGVSFAVNNFWEAMATPSYVFDIVIQQLALFSVPGFLVISGFFVVFVARGDPPKVSWSFVKTRVLNLLWPYLIWTLVYFALSYASSGELRSLDEYLRLTINGHVLWFAPLLMQCYLLAPFMVRWAKQKPVWLLAVTGAIQVAVTLPLYFVADYEQLARYGGNGTIALFVWWALYFPLGMVLGFHSKKIGSWLERHRRALRIGTVVFGALSLLESELVVRAIGWHGWGSNPNKFSSMGYAIFFVLFFLSLDRNTLPFAQQLEKIGAQTYGIYLSHAAAITVGAWMLNRLAGLLPFIRSVSLVYVPVMAVIGLAGPLLLMEVTKRLPIKRLYAYVFG